MSTGNRGLWLVAPPKSVQYGANVIGYSNARDGNIVSQLVAMGCTTVRIAWQWSDLQPTASLSSIFWSGPDAFVAMCLKFGISMTFDYYTAPPWANGGLAAIDVPTPGSANDVIWQAGFAAFVGAFAARYRGLGIIHEISNEQNTNNYWHENGSLATPSLSQYLSLLSVCRTAIKAADPNGIVSIGGLAALTHWSGSGATVGVTYLQSMMAAGFVADMISIHPYTNSGVYDPNVDSYPTGNSVKDIGRIQDAIMDGGADANGTPYANYMLRIGEHGDYSAATAGSEAAKAAHLKAAVTLVETTYSVGARGSNRAGVTHMTYFPLTNKTNGTIDTSDTGLYTGTPLIGPNTQLASGAALAAFLS